MTVYAVCSLQVNVTGCANITGTRATVSGRRAAAESAVPSKNTEAEGPEGGPEATPMFLCQEVEPQIPD